MNQDEWTGSTMKKKAAGDETDRLTALTFDPQQLENRPHGHTFHFICLFFFENATLLMIYLFIVSVCREAAGPKHRR